MMKPLGGLLAALVLGATAAVPLHAHDYSFGDLRITHPWAKASLKGVPNSAAYMAITNTGETDDTLIAASADVSRAVEIHTMTMKDGVMRMRQLEDGIPLPASETVTLEPGGLHVMLIGLNDRLEKGESFAMTLTFEKAGQLEVEAIVEDQQGSGGHNHGTHEMEHSPNENHE